MIEFKNVTKYYGKKIGVENINIKINENDIVIFHGSNGSGKSTTIKLILNFIKLGKKDSGTIINDFGKMSYIPERISLPHYTTGDDFIKDIMTLNNQDIDYLSLFKYFDLDPKVMIGSYSKGMRQKLGIIQALMTNSKLVLLDEPMSGLDSETQKKVVDMIKKEKNEKTFIISTHYLNLFDELNPLKICFESGRIV